MGTILIETTKDQNNRYPKAENRVTQLNNVQTGTWTWKTWVSLGGTRILIILIEKSGVELNITR